MVRIFFCTQREVLVLDSQGLWITVMRLIHMNWGLNSQLEHLQSPKPGVYLVISYYPLILYLIFYIKDKWDKIKK